MKLVRFSGSDNITTRYFSSAKISLAPLSVVLIGWGMQKSAADSKLRAAGYVGLKPWSCCAVTEASNDADSDSPAAARFMNLELNIV
jgi:hypothetical protein